MAQASASPLADHLLIVMDLRSQIGSVSCGPAMPMKKATVMKAMKQARAKMAMKAKPKAKVMKAAKSRPMKRAQQKQLSKPMRQMKADKSWANEVVGGTPMPDWADHCTKLLADGLLGFRQKTGNAREVQLSVWSDCGGMGTELTAMTHLADSVLRLTQQKLSISNFCFCDKKLRCREFAKVNHQPLHMSDDIFARDFDAGTFRCVTCGADHQFPPKTDVYVCCFPCGPWSMKGSRLGFSDRDGAIVWQAAKTINQLMPGVWYMENVMGLSSSRTGSEAAATDLSVITDTLSRQMPHYHTLCLHQLSPMMFGFPIQRKRIVIVGIRKELTKMDLMMGNFQRLVGTQLSCADWRVFLGRGQPKYDLSNVGTDLGDSASGADGCSCSVDPHQACPQHRCLCRHCRRMKFDQCGWRKTHLMYIKKHIGDHDVASWVANTSKLMSYLGEN